MICKCPNAYMQKRMYILVMVDPDAPRRSQHAAYWRHWLVVNIKVSLPELLLLHLICVGKDNDTDGVFYWIRKSYSMIEIYKVVFGSFFYFKVCIFIISWSHLAHLMFASA